jgi:formylglycine-generating enzyme required for sulfatase activity
MLRKGHHGVELDKEGWDRLITWIDINAPYYGTWTEVAANRGDAKKMLVKINQAAAERMECDKMYGGPGFNPEVYPEIKEEELLPITPKKQKKDISQPVIYGLPIRDSEVKKRQAGILPSAKQIKLSDDTVIDLSEVPAGNFVMGDKEGYSDEVPLSVVEIKKNFWMANQEITNKIYKMFDPEHESGYQDNFGKNNEGRGRPMNLPEQPVIRVSWHEAAAFCRWLSVKSGLNVRLPTEAEWEYAARAGSSASLNYGNKDDDFSAFENLADVSFLKPKFFFMSYPGVSCHPGVSWPFDARFNDGQTIPKGTGMYKPNSFGLYDMHGNVEEWTSTKYFPYPYAANDGREDYDGKENRTVRGGSWKAMPKDSRLGIRRSYPPWQRVVNVGIRIAAE